MAIHLHSPVGARSSEAFESVHRVVGPRIAVRKGRLPLPTSLAVAVDVVMAHHAVPRLSRLHASSPPRLIPGIFSFVFLAKDGLIWVSFRCVEVVAGIASDRMQRQS